MKPLARLIGNLSGNVNIGEEPNANATPLEAVQDLVVTPGEGDGVPPEIGAPKIRVLKVGAEEKQNVLRARELSVVPEEEFEKFKSSEVYRERKRLFPVSESDGQLQVRHLDVGEGIALKRHGLKYPIAEVPEERETTASNAEMAAMPVSHSRISKDGVTQSQPHSL